MRRRVNAKLCTWRCTIMERHATGLSVSSPVQRGVLPSWQELHQCRLLFVCLFVVVWVLGVSEPAVSLVVQLTWNLRDETGF